MPNPQKEVVKEKLKGAIQEFIERVASEQEQIPEREVYKVDEAGGEGRILVKCPGKTTVDYSYSSDKDTPILKEVCEWLYDSDYGYELQLSGEDGNSIENPGKDQVVPFYMTHILALAGETMNRNGGYIYTDDAFDSAFEAFYEDFYRSDCHYSVIAPLLNFNGPNEQIVLNSDVDVDNTGDHQGEVTHIEISPLTPREKSGIMTFESRMLALGTTGTVGAARWSHKLQFSVKSDGANLGGVESEVVDQVLTALRLFNSESSGISVNKKYRPNPNWLDYREQIANMGGSSGPLSVPSTFGSSYEFSRSDIDDFQKFWERHHRTINPNSGLELSTAIRRFNQSYSKETNEDSLVDCVIAFEATLLREITQHASYRFRLPLRAILLITERSEHEREYIYKFFKKVYDARSTIVHTGGELEAQRVDGQEISPRNFVDYTREFLRLTLLSYVENHGNGVDVRQTNQKLDEALKNALPPDWD